MEEKIKQLFAFIEEAENIVFFGGRVFLPNRGYRILEARTAYTISMR